MPTKLSMILSKAEARQGVSLFTQAELDSIDGLIVQREDKFFIRCQIRDRLIVAKPEEVIRQLWLGRLIREYGYPRERLDVEKVITFGARVDPGKADIVVFHPDLQHYYILFEVKRPSRTAGIDQLKSYCNAEGAPIGVWSNGNEMIRLHREEPNIFTEIPRIPKVSETLRDILTERWTLRWLEEHDELKQGKTTLKKIILDLEELVLGNAGVEPFEEIFKLVYAKLYDEWRGINDPNYQLSFYVGDRTAEEVKEAITNLLRGAMRTWSGVFEPTDKVELRAEHLKSCVSFLEKIKLFNSNLQVIDEAFEYLIPSVSKKKEGQFFTPRPVVDMVVKMLNPKSHEFVIDPACGSAGFLLHSVMWVAGGAITGRELPVAAKNFAQNSIFGIDFATKAVKIAKAINLIVGDGKSHIYKDNSLAPQSWSEDTKAGLRAKLSRFPSDSELDADNQTRFLRFDFDVLMTNPPFAGIVKERDVLRLYELADKDGRPVKAIGRHIIFINRSLQLLAPGGRMAIVLPQGILNNTNAEYIRRFVVGEAQILASVGLHVNTFKPHTGTKTSVLFLRKYTGSERNHIQEIRAKYQGEWDEFIIKLEKEHEGVTWETPVDSSKLPDQLTSFIETYFERTAALDEDEENGSHNDETEAFGTLVSETQELQASLDEKESQLGTIPQEQRSSLRKEITSLKRRLGIVRRDLAERTVGGRLWLVLYDGKVREQFKKFWLDNRIVTDIDYPIFLAVNQLPVKDESGDYNYLRQPNGEFVMDKHGHPKIDHDLDSIADAFITFAREQMFPFV